LSVSRRFAALADPARGVRLAVAALLGLGVVTGAHAGDVERQLEISITVDGQQTWRNGVQWSKATTVQRYDLSTRLRSDGKLQGANMLDLDMNRRIAIKQEYLRRKGLEEARRADGGAPPIPRTDEEKRQVSAQAQQELYNCKGDPDCMSSVVRRYSAIFAAAAPDGTPAGAEAAAALLDQPGRYLFFFGYDGCPNRIHATYQAHVEGEEAFDRARKNLVPFTLQRDADVAGDLADNKSLCWRYTAVVDTQNQQLFLDNVYLPSPRGSSVRTVRNSPQRSEEDLPPLAEALSWSSQTLRQAAESGAASATLNMGQPLDGNSTVGGSFEGPAKLTLKWSFLPVASSEAAPK
jgi:hypothetical protein